MRLSPRRGTRSVLTEICGYLKNWFNRKPDGTDYPKFHGRFVINDGVIRWDSGAELPLKEGQFYRILGGAYNNGGVYPFYSTPPSEGEDTSLGARPRDEEFEGEVWSMAVPPDVVALAGEIAAWNEKNGKADSAAMSPFNSESFGGYSYTKGRTIAGGSGVSWADAFASRLMRYKKL